jgi:hypothetical protein
MKGPRNLFTQSVFFPVCLEATAEEFYLGWGKSSDFYLKCSSELSGNLFAFQIELG